MVQGSNTLEKGFIFLAQTKNKDLEKLLANFITEKDIRFESVKQSENINEQQLTGQIITFVIGSDVDDPIQSAQRLHAFNEHAKIIILSKSQNVDSLKESIKFSPFIGVDVACLDETKEEELERKIKDILQASLKGEKYRDVIDETNSQISLTSSSQQSALNQRFINKLMDVAPIGIAIVGQRGNILGWNKEAASIFKRNEAQVLGKSLSHHFGPVEGNKLEDYLRESFEKRNNSSFDSLTLERELPGGSEQILNFTAAPFSHSGGAENALILTFKDVTERIQAQKELQEINQTLEERVKERTKSLLAYQNQLRSLASQLSKAEEKERRRLATELHDNLGQMLTVGKMKVNLLQQESSSEQKTPVIDELDELMDDAIDYTRKLMSDLKPPPTLDKEDVRATIKWLAKKMREHGLEVILEDDEQPKQTTEEIRTTLLQSVRELLYNIIKHTEVDKAHIKMSRLNDHVQIIVEDKGKGMDTNTEIISSTERGEFGLFNIKERMDLLGGSVEINSEPGVGTKAKLVAPLKHAEERQIKVDEDGNKYSTTVEEPKQEITVLLVDDHKMMRNGLRKIVDEQEDLKVIGEASNGEEAIELAREKNPDIIVMDVNMPVIDGIDATKEIMSILPEVRVVALSLHENKELINEMRSVGASAYITKNEAFESLAATIRSEANSDR